MIQKDLYSFFIFTFSNKSKNNSPKTITSTDSIGITKYAFMNMKIIIIVNFTSPFKEYNFVCNHQGGGG